MKSLKACLLLSACSTTLAFAQTTAKPAPSPLPHLQKNGQTAHQTVQMIVDGKPYLMLAGELHNSSASSAAYMQPLWPKLAEMHLNTVVSTASWELVEPEEGKFDFALVDSQIRAAHEHNLHLVLIWFGTWKNASSSYVPLWIKRDPQRYPMATTKTGQPNYMGLPFETLSSLGEATIAADAKAFRALMRHIRETDIHHTVLMMQVENETGILGDSRDRSPLAEAAWSGPVPQELLTYLTQHKDTLLPELTKVWSANGFKTSGTWPEVFGKDPAAEEVFMAWHVAHAVNEVAAAGKGELPIPMYANAWLGPQPKADTPGQYPSGGPVTGMLDVWRAAAPKLDLFAPDIYIADFAGVTERQVRSGNPLFIPEARTNVANLFWAVGHHNALGYAPFGIEEMADYKPLSEAYEALGGLAPQILKYQVEGKVMTVLEGNEASVKQFESATGLTLKFGDMRSAFAPAAQPGDKPKDLPPAPAADGGFSLKPEVDPRGYALVIQTAPDAFTILGTKVVLLNGHSHIGTVDEGHFEKGIWVQGRRLNGDETVTGNFVILSPDLLELRKIVTYQAK